MSLFLYNYACHWKFNLIDLYFEYSFSIFSRHKHACYACECVLVRLRKTFNLVATREVAIHTQRYLCNYFNCSVFPYI